jgi:RNA polymerase sigma factor (sigma-70 family)
MVDEAEILIGLKAGNKQAFDWLFDALYTRLRFFVEQITNDEFESQDIAMHAISKFWEKGARDFETFVQVKSFIFKIARHKAYNYLKRNKIKQAHQRNLVYMSPIVENSFVEKTFYKVEMLQALLQEIEKLPDQCRDVVKMVYFENMDRSLVAEKLNISLSTVHVHCRNAKIRLKQIFSEKELIILLLLVGLYHN